MNEVCAQFLTPDGRERVTALFEFSAMEDSDPLKIPDHAGFYETSLMMHLTDRVNASANAGQEIPELAMGTNRPMNEASAEQGAAIFAAQVTSIVKYVQRKFNELNEGQII
jgi:creatinine amidohydrolase/Fe(II)-dependent formamide hydrolase-like protein